MTNASLFHITVRSLLEHPVPTEAQCAAFVEHVASAHSWYKHLSFVHRAPFVVFLAEPLSEDDRARFGDLRYAWRIPDSDEPERWRSDGEETLDVAPDLFARAGFTLGPFVSTDPNAIEVIVEEWRSDPRLETTLRDRLDALGRAHAAWDEAYRALSDEDAARAVDPPRDDDPVGVRRVRDAERTMTLLFDSHRREEAHHIARGITELLALRASLRE